MDFEIKITDEALEYIREKSKDNSIIIKKILSKAG